MGIGHRFIEFIADSRICWWDDVSVLPAANVFTHLNEARLRQIMHSNLKLTLGTDSFACWKETAHQKAPSNSRVLFLIFPDSGQERYEARRRLTLIRLGRRRAPLGGAATDCRA